MPSSEVSPRLRIAGIFFRSIFVAALLVVAARVSAPQHIGSTWLDIALRDYIRAAVGLAFCIWVLIHLFIPPRDARGYGTWVYLGIALAPVSVACAIAVWFW
jgi:hypothetical protein